MFPLLTSLVSSFSTSDVYSSTISSMGSGVSVHQVWWFTSVQDLVISSTSNTMPKNRSTCVRNSFTVQ